MSGERQGIAAFGVFVTDDPLSQKLVIGISTRALFDLDAENEIFEREGLAAYRAHQRAHENDTLDPGTAFELVRGLLSINRRAQRAPLVEVILLSRNDADSSMRVFNSIEAHGLAISRGAFRGGRDPWPYLPAFHCDLFLSAEPAAVRAALEQGTPAALVLRPPETVAKADDEVRIAFDGDAVLFDEESDLIYRRDGPEAFFRFESEHAETPLSPGPFRPFLQGLARVQAMFPAGDSPIRTALVTARNAPAHKRVVNTFRAWGIAVDEAYFLGGINKAEILTRFRPHIFFDDSLAQLERAATEVPSAHVPTKADQLTFFGAHTGRGPRPRRTPRPLAPPKEGRRRRASEVSPTQPLSVSRPPEPVEAPSAARSATDSASPTEIPS